MERDLGKLRPDWEELSLADSKEVELLVQELMKSRGNQEKVRKQMERLGLPFSEDPLEQMATLLTALQAVEKP